MISQKSNLTKFHSLLKTGTMKINPKHSLLSWEMIPTINGLSLQKPTKFSSANSLDISFHFKTHLLKAALDLSMAKINAWLFKRMVRLKWTHVFTMILEDLYYCLIRLLDNMKILCSVLLFKMIIHHWNLKNAFNRNIKKINNQIKRLKNKDGSNIGALVAHMGNRNSTINFKPKAQSA